MIKAMEARFGTKNTYNKYINDNLLQFQVGVRQSKKTPDEVAYDMNKNLMVSLGYKHVEAIELGLPKGTWREAAVHWFKDPKDALQ